VIVPRSICTAIALLLLSACSKAPRSTTKSAAVNSAGQVDAASPSPTVALPQPKRPYNVLLIIIDAMRADMPWAGYQRDVVPWLNRFQQQNCVNYTQSYAISSYTAKSVIPMLAGKYPSEMKRDGYFFTRWPDADTVLISERMQKAGIRTLTGQAHAYLAPGRESLQGFDDHRMIPGKVELTETTAVTDDRLWALAKQMLSVPKNVSQEGGKRFFAYFHFMDPHHTYERHFDHPNFGKKARDLYDNELHWSDSWVGKLVDWAREQPWAGDTAFIIMGDHGEGFGEHRHYRHGFELWESVIKVPLMFCIPGVAPRMLSVRRSHIDLAPTLADLMGLKVDPPLRGISLVPEIFGSPQPERPIVSDLPHTEWMERRRAVIVGGYKLISFGQDEHFKLYNLNDDPREENELSAQRPDELARMKAVYGDICKTIPEVPDTGVVKPTAATAAAAADL
jgi:choline-sulfatase